MVLGDFWLSPKNSTQQPLLYWRLTGPGRRPEGQVWPPGARFVAPGARRAFSLGKSALNQTFPESLEVTFKVACPQKDHVAIF